MSRLVNFTKSTPDFNRKFYDLFTQKLMVDVTLSADGQFVQAHKVVLAVASSWFEVNLQHLCAIKVVK
jgi:BTB/POZ domain